MVSTIEMLTEIYPEHIWIDLSKTGQIESKLSPEQLRDRDYTLSQVDLNQLCMVAIKKWLGEVFDLELKSVFPCVLGEKENLEFISKLVNGFALQLGKTRLVFIPSHSIDLTEIEIPQEWVDLPNWAADYYVPIQVDVEGKYLHLWTFISHYDLKNNYEFDSECQNYEITDDIETKNLDVLFTACELHALGELTPKRAALDLVPALATDDANQLIEQLQRYRSGFSPRLELSFERWGAILNDRDYLTQYLVCKIQENNISLVLILSGWFEKTETAIIDFKNAGYLAFKDFHDKPILMPGFIGWEQKTSIATGYMSLRTTLARMGNDLNTKEKIREAVKSLYANQNSTERVHLPHNINSPEELLIYLMKHTTNEALRWEVAGCLWSINPEPNNNHHWERWVKDLGLANLRLMIATIPLANGEYAVYAHVYALGNQELPPNVQIMLISEDDEELDRAESRSQDPYVRMSFTAMLGERFNICVSVNETSITQAFAI
jgi:Protein of unknown function (DUF1822)